MGFFDQDAPPAREYGTEMGTTLRDQWRVMRNKWFPHEEAYQPKFAGLTGTSYSTLLNSILPGQAAAQTTGRVLDVADLATLGPAVGQAALNINPYQSALMGALNQRGLEELQLGSSIDPDTIRAMQQSIAGAAGARGWSGLDPGDMARTAMQTGLLGQQLRQQRFANAAGLGQMNQAMVDPYARALMGPSALGAGAAQTAAGLLGQSGPRVFNPESSYAGNLYAQNYGMAATFAPSSILQRINMLQDTMGKGIGYAANAFGGVMGGFGG